ncbi:MAG: phosphoenolpyruvate--protein phosphotransferase [Burkholderiaceae bacterium]|jgi:phosphotransferase system enzyme I (PtsI)|nr:phosphoenolpyruvate--protein phosphotransferase [Burkholderiaceae bacterium]
MTITIQGIPVARGIAIGRAAMMVSGYRDVAHYLIRPEEVRAEIERVRNARQAVADELTRLRASMTQRITSEAAQELMALLEVHQMMLQDELLSSGVEHWINNRLYNAEWALTTQIKIIARQFDEMEDEYLRERKSDLEQVAERILRQMKKDGAAPSAPPSPTTPAASFTNETAADLLYEGENPAPDHALDSASTPLVLIAHDLSPADMIQFKRSVFTGFITDTGGRTSHTAIAARGMDIPAVVGARGASILVRQDDWVIIDGDTGVIIVDPSPIILAEYSFKQRQDELERTRLERLRNKPAITLDGQRIDLLANIGQPEDAAAALRACAVGVGLFRSEFLFIGREAQGQSRLPDEDEQYAAYRRTIEAMHGLPITIRTVDIGADKPLDSPSPAKSAPTNAHDDAHVPLNPALGLRAIRWSLADPDMFLTQLRAILRAAAHGPVSLLIPMVAHIGEIRQTFALIDTARAQLTRRGLAYGHVQIGAMIEVPAAALMLPVFLRYFDFLSIGTNDLIQYTLAIDRADESVAHLYDPLHPAVLRLVADTIDQSNRLGKSVSVCGEMAGDTAYTRLLLGLGLRSFSMHPSQILDVKQEILRADAQRLTSWAQRVLQSEDPAGELGRA